MKHFTLFASFALAVLSGCGGVSVQGKGDEKLTVLKPMSESIKRGERGDVMVAINRNNFDEEVELDLEGLPDGVKVLNHSLVISKGASTITLLLEAATDAELVKDHVVEVHAKGPDGMKVTQTFDITVRPAS